MSAAASRHQTPATEPATNLARASRQMRRLVKDDLHKRYNVIGASVGPTHVAVWTREGHLFTSGDGQYGKLGHGKLMSKF